MSDIKPVGTGPLTSAGARPPAASAGGDFRLPSAANSAPSAAAGLPAGADLSTVLALGAAEERRRRNHQARRRGEDLLGVLAQLQRALLADAAPGATIGALRSLLIELPDAADPELAVMLRAIALRARIALALHG